jgi:collagenase-like PrtC family protease
MELLAPAGDRACFDAALEAGADAVYLGLTALNARRYARNFSERELCEACRDAHALGRRVYLTLNIDLAQDELVRAAEILEVASGSRVDAVLVRDPALLALKPCFPELTYHASTQACIASRADVEAARELGFARVVLARELSLDEIRAASQVPGIVTEVFALGALCFSMSGRCLLSSWVGGRSGNRGQCTSPCRVPWMIDGRPAGTPFSLQDLSLVRRIDALREAGVSALKVEGRMKNPSWVRAAVAALRRAIDGEPAPRATERRGVPPGRKLTSAYLDARRDDLLDATGCPVSDDSTPQAPSPPERRLRTQAAAILAAMDRAEAAEPTRTPDRARLTVQQVSGFLRQVQPADAVVVEGLNAERIGELTADFPNVRVIAAQPSVLFDDTTAEIEALCRAAASLGVTVEVNTWGGWHVARRCGVRFVAGPGLGVLNALAAEKLEKLGFEEACADIEIDSNRLEALLARATLPCSVVVFGRPALLLTRAALPDAVTSAELEDRRAVRLRARPAHSLWELRPVTPFDVRGLRLPEAAHWVVDLVDSPDPVAEWLQLAPLASQFNFRRVLG